MNDHTLMEMQRQPKPARQSDEWLGLARAALALFILLFLFLIYVEVEIHRAESSQSKEDVCPCLR
ncbi:MAG: hypothetical protein WC421_02970 [Elusimicrobiales bacterium]